MFWRANSISRPATFLPHLQRMDQRAKVHLPGHNRHHGRLPAHIPRRPSDGFVSWLFGGPVPLRGPTGNVIGYYDHQAARAGLEITGHAANLAQNVYTPDIPVGMLEHVAPAAAAAVFRAIEEWIELHHPLPKFMGGPLRQELEALKVRSHRLFHAELASELRKAGHLPVGGRAGSRDKWLKYFAKHPEAEREVIEILR